MATAAETPRRKLGEEYAGLEGDPLETIANEEVEISAISITTRLFRGDPNAKFALVTLTDGRQVHTWSASLIEKLEMIPESALPGPTRFHQVPTSAGRKVWTLD